MSNDICFSFIIFFINSIIKNDECPSFIWYKDGFSPKVFNSLTPAIPRTISCDILISWFPPYNVVVISLYSSLFSSMSESIKYKVTLPTLMLHTFKYNLLLGNFTNIIKSCPFSSFTGFIGSEYISIFLYSVSCSP